MATRNHPAVSQQSKGAPELNGKPKAAVGRDDQNRKALEDIGNLNNLRVTDRKHITRPITRSFGAQLLANAQAAAAAAAHKKQIAPLADGAVNKKPPWNVQKQIPPLADGAVNKKPSAKAPKPQVVIHINPDTKEKAKQETKAILTSFSKKKVHTLTSVLTARSKFASGIQDIDAEDAENEFAMAEYVEDIYKFYKQHENSCRPGDYMSSQAEINAKMRAILVDWLIEVHHKFQHQPETLYLTVHIIDRFLSVQSVVRKELQLIGVSSMLIACKYEEIWAPEVNDFLYISDWAYTREQILKMEKQILNKLEWSLTFPTPYTFVVRFLKAALSDKEMEHMTFFFAELALIHYSMIMYCPSMIAASAIYAAQCTLRKSPRWNRTLQYHTGFSEKQLMECGKLMVDFHSSALEDSKLAVVFKKYSKEELGGVAKLTPASKFFEDVQNSSVIEDEV